MSNGEGMSAALKTLTRMLRLGELSEQGAIDALTMAHRIANDETATERDRINAGKLIFQAQKLALDSAIEINRNERLDQGKSTENVKLYGEFDPSKV
jgi:hypothetical protein